MSFFPPEFPFFLLRIELRMIPIPAQYFLRCRANVDELALIYSKYYILPFVLKGLGLKRKSINTRYTSVNGSCLRSFWCERRSDDPLEIAKHCFKQLPQNWDHAWNNS